VPRGQTTVVYNGILYFVNGMNPGAQGDVELAVYLGEQRLGAVTHRNNWPWTRFAYPLPRGTAQAPAVSVTFEVSSPKAFARTFCFHAEMRR
jgi:hypothetical protein